MNKKYELVITNNL